MCLADSSARPPRQVRCSGDTLRAASRRRESDPASVALDLCRWPRRQCGQLPRREFLSERSGWSDGRCRPQLFGLIVTGAKESIPAKLGSGRKYLSTRLLMQRRVLKRLKKDEKRDSQHLITGGANFFLGLLIAELRSSGPKLPYHLRQRGMGKRRWGQ